MTSSSHSSPHPARPTHVQSALNMERASTCPEKINQVPVKNNALNEYSIIDIQGKMTIARAIVMSCKYNKDIFKRKWITDDKLEMLIKDITFIPLNTIKSFLCTVKPGKSFETFLSKLQHNCTVPHEWLRSIIYTSYLKDEIVPTKEKILKNKKKSEKYTVKELNEDLKANGFVLKKLGNTSKALIVEEPKQVYKRMKYLNKIRNYRKQKKTFVYITYKDEEFAIAVCPYTGVVSFVSYPDSSEDKDKLALTFVESIMSHLSKSSVIIIDSQDRKLDSPPNQYSSKQQMQAWLKQYNIPYETEAHTAELFALIQKFGKMHKDSCKMMHFMESYGFVVLRVPNEPASLSYFNPVFDQIKGLPYMSEAQYVRNIFGKYGHTELVILEETVKKEEIKVYSEDLELEKITDTIRAAAMQMVFLPKDLKSCCIYDAESVPSYIILD